MSEVHFKTTGPRHKPAPKAPESVDPGAPQGVPVVALVDHPGSGAPKADVLLAYASAMQKSLDRDFLPAYGKTAIVIVASPDQVADTADFVLGLFKDPDQPGALGYHDLSPDGLPFGKIFPLLDAQDGANLSTTIDHELKEMIEDATIDLARMGDDGQFWADEPCDAVERDEYEVDGVPLSNFVLPGWYSGVGGKVDFLGKLVAPRTLSPGGYAQYFDPAKGWQQIVSQRKAPRRYRRIVTSRPARRRALLPRTSSQR